jgi:hypothetical protein
VAHPETALERALLDREEALHRVEADLHRERGERNARVLQLQRQLDKAMAEGLAMMKGSEDIKMAFAAAQMAHDRETHDKEKREKLLAAEMAALKVRAQSNVCTMRSWCGRHACYARPSAQA